MNIKKETVKIEGIILKTFDYLEQDKILHVFTGEGIKHFIIKGMRKKNSSSASPLVLAEFLYAPQNLHSNLLPCYEIFSLNFYLYLRKDLSKLKIACLMSQVLYDSQLPDNPSVGLYHLFKEYLKKIEVCSNLVSLFLSFRLKLLKYEGTFSIDHVDEIFSFEEKGFIEILVDSKSLNEITGLNISPELSRKIEAFILGNDDHCLCHLPFKY